MKPVIVRLEQAANARRGRLDGSGNLKRMWGGQQEERGRYHRRIDEGIFVFRVPREQLLPERGAVSDISK